MPQRWQQYGSEMVKTLSVPYRPQWTPFTCGPACLQMMLAHRGIRISHLRATRELQAFPGGTDLEHFRTLYQKLSGKKLNRITFRGVRRALNRGVPVLAVDSASSPQDHVVVLTGYRGDMFRIHDPDPFSLRRGFSKRWRIKDDLIAAAEDEFYAPRS